MTWAIGSFIFPDDEIPLEDSEHHDDGGEQVWSEFDPIGSNTTILTYLGTKSERHALKATVKTASKTSLKAIFAAHAEVTYTHPFGSATVLMREFRARANGTIISEQRWDCEILLVER